MTQTGDTPKRENSHNVLQVPSSLPINVKSSPQKQNPPNHPSVTSRVASDGDSHKDEMRKRFYSHKAWPIISKQFYYLSESELFKGMVRGKGNLRDISLWLTDNIPLKERLAKYEKDHPETTIKTDSGKPDRLERLEIGKSNLELDIRKPEIKSEIKSEIKPKMEPESPYDDEDSSPLKRGKARQKRPLLEQPKLDLASTKIELHKPKVSILEKYRNRNVQPKIDYMFQQKPLQGAEQKRRRLVRADNEGLPARFAPKSPSPAFNGGASSLSAAFAHKDGDSPQPAIAPSRADDDGFTGREVFDNLEQLEEKIRNNRKRSKAAKPARSEDELEEDDFSDNMSQDDGDDAYGGGLTSIDGQILEFLNNAPTDDIMEICNIPPKVADILVSKRPFTNIHALADDRFDEATPEPDAKTKKRGGQRKAMGLKIVENTEFSLKGYKAVDSLIKKCSEYGNLISKQMDRWGVNVTGDGELDVVDVKVDKEDEDDEDDDVGSSSRGLSYIKHKPTLLSPDMELKSFQQVGINWLNLLYQNHLSCILADEMGLGKTCQVISFMAYLKAVSDKKQPHLVVVPSSTLENWLREFHKFCPDMVVQAYYGSQAEREDLRYELMESEYDVLVTTYNLATGAAPDFKFLRLQNFDMVVFDEGHMLKNSNSERYNKLMRLKAHFRLLLTGTPLQNNLKELVSLLAFMLPQLFVEKREDLQGLFNKKASVDSSTDHNPLLSQQAINKAKTMMTPFVLRRKKAQVLKYLPGKHHEVIKCPLTESQRAIYSGYIAQGKEARRKKLAAKENGKAANSKANGKTNGSTAAASSSNVMMSLRKASMHPLLFRTLYTDKMLRTMSQKIMKEPEYVNANMEYIFEDMQVMSDYELNGLCERFPNTLAEFILEEARWFDSGKVTKLLEVVEKVISKKEKVLVFSLFTQMLDILEKVLSFSNITFLRLDGQTSVETRQDVIDRFYEDDTIPVFLLSTKAGGFGINLIAANNVVIFDQSFNPHDDKQAEDRAHRVGQTNEVLVTKLISENTIDENILMLAENKLQLDQSISNEENESKLEEKASSMFEKIIFGE